MLGIQGLVGSGSQQTSAWNVQKFQTIKKKVRVIHDQHRLIHSMSNTIGAEARNLL